MKFTDNFKKNFETSDNSYIPELSTRYYRAKDYEGMEAIKEMIREISATIMDENEYYLEILFEKSDFACTSKVTAISVMEIAIDFNITTFNLIGLGKGIKLIKSFYDMLDKKLTLKGVGLYRG